MELRPLAGTGVSVPAVGIGTWNMGGPNRSRDPEAVEAIRLGLDLGMWLIDTAEMYGAGHVEEIVARAVQGRRDQVFIASKVSPQHFAHDDVLRASRSSLKRLGVKHLDLYQLHWPNPRIPISETMKAMEKRVQDGLVTYIGVSNFSVDQMKDAQAALSKEQIVSNQVEYSLIERSIEEDLLPYCKKQNVTVIAYSPLGQGKIPSGNGRPFNVLDKIADKLGKTRCQVALNWLLKDQSVIIIPKAIRKEHVRENAEVTEWRLGNEDYEALSEAFSR